MAHPPAERLPPHDETAATSSAAARGDRERVRHYVYFNVQRGRIAEPWFLASASFDGAQLKYRWRELEPDKDQYDFSSIRHDLALLRGNE